MRLLFNPLTITADGITVDRDLQGALIFLDQGKKGSYTKADISAALQSTNLSHLADMLHYFGDCKNRMELKEGEHKDHLINCYIGRADRQRYADTVLHDTQDPAFRQNIERFLEGSLERIANTDLAAINKRTVELKNPWEILQYDRAQDTTFRQRFAQTLDAIPSYCGTLIKADPSLTVICSTGLIAGIAGLGALGAAGDTQIRLSYRDFCEGSKQSATSLLHEEILHRLDDSIGASTNPAFQRAASALLGNASQMAAIEQLCKQANPEKRPIQEYPASHHIPELFVSYFLIRDHVLMPAGKHGAANAPVPAKVTEKMIQLFGKELHELCVAAEETLKHKAQQVQSGTANAGAGTLSGKHAKRDPHKPDGSAQGYQ